MAETEGFEPCHDSRNHVLKQIDPRKINDLGSRCARTITPNLDQLLPRCCHGQCMPVTAHTVRMEMDDDTDELVYLTYADAARRVRRDTRTVKRWARQGMPVEWRVDDGGLRFRVVEESVLLAWWRDRMAASPVHYYRLRRIAIDNGLPEPQRPRKVRTSQEPVGSENHDPTHNDGENVGTSGPTVQQVLAELPPFVGQAEHAALVRAMEDEPPACDGLEVFTADRFDDPEQTEMMRGICRSCPLLELCTAFAIAGRPSAGMWAGKTPAEIRRLAQAKMPALA